MLSVASCSGIGLRKRRNENDSSDSSAIKMSRSAFYFVLESESDIPSSGEETESIISLQNRSTDFAKDTSDTSSKTSHRESDVDSLVGVEYEPMTPTEQEQERPFNGYSSGTDSDLCEPLGRLSEREDNDSVLAEADYSSGPSEQDTLPPTLRLRKCVKCNAVTNQYQYCHHCYEVRKDFFPPRPKRYKKKSLKPFFRKKPCFKEPKLPVKEIKDDSWVESSSSQEQSLTPNLPDNTEGLCNVCYTNPKNGAFLHCRWVHVYSCYQCSLEHWFKRKRCPLCNSKIRQVLKVAIG